MELSVSPGGEIHMNISADHNNGTAGEDLTQPHPVLTVNHYRLDQNALRPLAHSLGLNPVFCPKIPHNFETHLFDQLCAPPSTWTPFGEFVAARHDDPGRVALRTLLEQDYQDGTQSQFRAASTQPHSLERHAILSSVTPKFAHGITPPELMALLQGGDLGRVVLPVIDTFINVTDGYLTNRIPPHVGHGHSRMLAFAKPEVIEEHEQAEAQQDRGSASGLLKKLKDFLTTGDAASFTLFMRKFNTCGDWLWWLARQPEGTVTHPEAEQVLANTIVRLMKFKEFTLTYQDEFMTPGMTESFARWQWSEPCSSTKRIDPLAYPLLASSLDIFTRDDFKHL